VETLRLFSGLSNKKSRGSTQATTAATATPTAATTPQECDLIGETSDRSVRISDGQKAQERQS
jgi:hypothetical protein